MIFRYVVSWDKPTWAFASVNSTLASTCSLWQLQVDVTPVYHQLVKYVCFVFLESVSIVVPLLQPQWDSSFRAVKDRHPWEGFLPSLNSLCEVRGSTSYCLCCWSQSTSLRARISVSKYFMAQDCCCCSAWRRDDSSWQGGPCCLSHSPATSYSCPQGRNSGPVQNLLTISKTSANKETL